MTNKQVNVLMWSILILIAVGGLLLAMSGDHTALANGWIH